MAEHTAAAVPATGEGALRWYQRTVRDEASVWLARRRRHLNVNKRAKPVETYVTSTLDNFWRQLFGATPKLREALALVGTGDRVFTPDTSISHAASAFGKRAVVLLKREHHPYAPWGNPAEIVFWDGETIEGLRVEPVREAVARLVGG